MLTVVNLDVYPCLQIQQHLVNVRCSSVKPMAAETVAKNSGYVYQHHHSPIKLSEITHKSQEGKNDLYKYTSQVDDTNEPCCLADYK